MGYSLSFYQTKNGSGILKISLFQQIVSIVAFFVVGGAFVFNAINNNPLLLNGIFMTLIFIACLYQEKWTFSTIDQSITFSFGIAFFVSKTKIPIENIETLKIVKVFNGKDKLASIQLIFRALEKEVVIDSGKKRHAKKIEQNAHTIANILGIELEIIEI